ncbi:MAG TPA: ATP-binding protein [Deltaproteobacteria bacterium]|nr:ATP-binding protein [Deltaproteobacteria bacterium]HPR55739.1 ATP-binding protein [Deltaproteobacteria bacterium]
MRKILPNNYLRYSIWLTALIVVVLIILLALTVYYVRERAIIELFSQQQASIADQKASRISETVAKCEKVMVILSRLASAENGARQDRSDLLETLHEELPGIILTVVEIDRDDVIRSEYPHDNPLGMLGSRVDDPSIIHALKKMHHRYVGELSIPSTSKGQAPSKTVAIGVPLIDAEDVYQGALLAVLDPGFIIGRRQSPGTVATGDFWLVDESGTLVFHPDSSMIGKSVEELSPPGTSPFRMFAYTSRHYNDIVLTKAGTEETCIVAYAPIRIGIAQWWVVLVTPHERVLSPVRRASMNIMLGAMGLIVVVIITAVSITRSDVKRLRLKEELKRLKEREEWQSKLLREKMTMEGIVEGSPVPMFVIDKSHTVILWNRACTDLTGWSPEEMIGTDNYYKPFYEIKRPFLADFIVDGNVDDFETFYGEGKVVKSESIEGAYEAVKHFTKLKGENRHLHFLAAPIYDEKGEVVAAIETFLDVSKEVELTRNLQEYAETLQNELEENIRLNRQVENLYRYLQSILDSLPDKVYELNRDGIINYVSRQISSGTQDPHGKHFTEYTAPEHRDYVIAKFEDAKRGIFKPYELEFVDKEGKKRYLFMTPGPVKGTDRFVLVERDITELKELEKKYYESQKLAAIGQLSAGIAHEVRNPLSSIKMSLQILEKRIHPEGNDLKRFKIAQREVEHLEKLVSDVLIYAKPSDPHRTPCDMRSIVDQAMAMVEKSIKDKEIDISKHYQEELGLINVDPAMINQALINIFQNAIDAMNKGGRLDISLKSDSSSLTIEVEDNGCGIPEEDLPYLFNPFFTKKSYGTGLGLTQVEKIIDQHEGTIEVHSIRGEGTKFMIVLPKDVV